ncbi:MAG: extracellular solute-binding protein [Leptolyngbyaceae bacterium]|nr:extracellular solute-binding protein [Leptolyngbyaceae bacterium]
MPSIPHFRPNRRQFLQTSAATLTGMALSSCGWTLANVRSQPPAKSDPGKLHIYTWSNYADESLLQGFTAQTGIQVTADVFDSNETMLAKMLAGGGGAYSVLSPSDYMVTKMVQQKLLVSLDSAQLVGLDSLFPRFQSPSYDRENAHSIPISWGTTGLIYNADKLKEAPQDWQYLWDHKDKLSKRLTLFNDVREVMGATLRMLGYSYNSQNPAELKQAYEKLAELKPAIASFTSDAWRNQIVTGDLWIAMSYSPDAVEMTKESSQLQYVIPQSGTSVWTDTMVIPKSAPNPEGAYAWLNYILQPSVGIEISKRLNFATPNQAVFDQLPAPLRNNLTLFPPEALLAKCESIAPVDDVVEIYERYWTQLTSS